MPGPITRLRRLVREGPSDAPGRVVDALGRVGLVGYGVVHLLVAWLALQVAFGVPDVAADAQGAIGTVAATPFGTAALAVAVVCLLAFALWQVVAAAIGFRWVRGGERFRKSWGAVAKAVAMTALAALTVDYLVGRADPPGDPAARRLAADLLALPAGRTLGGPARPGTGAGGGGPAGGRGGFPRRPRPRRGPRRGPARARRHRAGHVAAGGGRGGVRRVRRVLHGRRRDPPRLTAPSRLIYPPP
ncbi:MAG: DUF1206 domain-containing protein [Pseudonocardia sp.]